MSVTLTVYLHRSEMLTPERWRKAIRDAGFPLDLDTDFDIDSFSGFLPCRIRDSASGFEFYSAPVAAQELIEVETPPGCDFSVTLMTSSDPQEFATSLLAASALCHASGGLLYDPQSGYSWSFAHVLAWAREQWSELERQLG